jgi:hypothetical protein
MPNPKQEDTKTASSVPIGNLDELSVKTANAVPRPVAAAKVAANPLKSVVASFQEQPAVVELSRLDLFLTVAYAESLGGIERLKLAIETLQGLQSEIPHSAN